VETVAAAKAGAGPRSARRARRTHGPASTSAAADVRDLARSACSSLGWSARVRRVYAATERGRIGGAVTPFRSRQGRRVMHGSRVPTDPAHPGFLLVPLADRHLVARVELDSDSEVLRYLSGAPTRGTRCRESRAPIATQPGKVLGHGHWMAVGTDGGERGTRCPAAASEAAVPRPDDAPSRPRARPPDDPEVADLGYRIMRRYWRQGLATEASRALLRHAFLTVAVRRVIAQTWRRQRGNPGRDGRVGMVLLRTYSPMGGAARRRRGR
jgi:RimJ/RimL family protein N-acetyltransferase